MPKTEQKKRPAKKKAEQAVVEVETTDSEKRTQKLNDIDELLDEIDEVLEENAEDFVRAYIQKGGE